MSILRLQILVLIDQLKKVTAVAEELGVKQPTVSFHMRKLEEEWGARLFEIKTGKVLLTEPGRMLLRYAAEIDRLYKEAQSRFQIYRDHGKHQFVIGTTEAATPLLLSRNWQALVAQSAQMRVQLLTGPHDRLLAQLQAGELDLLISGSFPDRTVTASLLYEELPDERLMLFMDKQHPLAATASLPPYKLAGHRFVALADAALQEALLAWELQERVSPSFDWSTDRIELALGAVTGGGMLAVLPAAAAAIRSDDRILQLPLPGQPAYLKPTAAWRSDYWHPVLMQRVVAVLSIKQSAQ